MSLMALPSSVWMMNPTLGVAATACRGSMIQILCDLPLEEAIKGFFCAWGLVSQAWWIYVAIGKYRGGFIAVTI